MPSLSFMRMSSFSGLMSLFWVSIVTYLIPLFGFIIQALFRLPRKKSSYSTVHREKISGIELNTAIVETEEIEEKEREETEEVSEEDEEGEVDIHGIEISGKDDPSSEEESPKLVFKFQSYEDFCRSNGRKEDSVIATSKYEFMMAGEGFRGFIEEPEAVTSKIEELYANSEDASVINKENFQSENDFIQVNSEPEAFQKDEIEELSEEMPFIEDESEELSEKMPFTEDRNEQSKNLDVVNEIQDASVEEEIQDKDYDKESIVSSEEFSVRNDPIDSNSDGSLSDRDFEVTEAEENLSLKSKQDGFGDRDIMAELKELEDTHLEVHEVESFANEDADILEDYAKLEKETQLHNSGKLGSDNFLSDRDFEVTEAEEKLTFEGEQDGFGDRDIMAELKELEDTHLRVYEVESFANEDADILEDYEQLEKETQLHNSHILGSDNFLSEDDFHGTNQGELSSQGDGHADGLDNFGKSNSKNLSEPDDSQNLETLWEHQELVEQLKMEIRKVRATGLPTILEESESSPKIMEDLQPWKIEEKFRQEDRSNLHKFYKSYRERMRKFDILNYQKMYAIGVLQSKDALQSTQPSQISSAPAIASQLLQNLRLNKHEKVESEPVVNFMREMHSDLELVYVGQMCLSWEILHWQYEKALEIWESDPLGTRRFNEVAGEFQQFQVLLQRFIEDERFQGPRVENYVKNRCTFRNLLQIPIIRVDNLKEIKTAIREGRKNFISSSILVEIMEESIRTFWKFVRADKHDTSIIPKGRRETQPGLQNPADSQLLAEVKTSLRKKEKKLKDLMRAGNCILRKFQKHHEDDSDQVLQFFSQVDLKLVSRVLHMSQITTDQLVWCRNKLSAISFVNRKIHVESSFLLFPC